MYLLTFFLQLIFTLAEENLIFFNLTVGGASSPLSFFDPSNQTDMLRQKWNLPPSHLTNSGERSSYIAGRYFRSKFCKDDIGVSFDPTEIKMYTLPDSLHYRTSIAFLNGVFFEADNKEQLNDYQKSKAKPPVVFPSEQEEIDKLEKSPLPKGSKTFPIYDMPSEFYLPGCKGYNENYLSKDVEFSDLSACVSINYYPDIAKDTVMTSRKDFTDNLLIKRFIQDLFANKAENNELPKEIKERFIDSSLIQNYMQHYYSSIIFKSDSDEISRYLVSNILNWMIEKIKKRIEHNRDGIGYSEEDPKFFSLTINAEMFAALTKTLFYSFEEELLFKVPEFSSSIEIRVFKQEEVFIRLFINGVLSKTFKSEQFFETLKESLFDEVDVKEFCESNYYEKNNMMLLIMVGMFVVMAVFSVATYFYLIWYYNIEVKTSTLESLQ